MKKLSLLAVGLGSGALFVAGAAMAAPPSGFSYDDYTVNAGQITAGACPTGYTCQTLQNDTGFLQQRISDGTADGSYFRTIVVDDDASALDPSQVQDLAFRNDAFVNIGLGGVASQGSVQLEGDNGSGVTTFDLARGAAFNDGTEADYRIAQDQNLGDRTVAFSFEAAATRDGTSMRVDQMNPTGGAGYSGPMTVRRISGSYVTCDEAGGTGCVLELPDGQQLTYDSGDTIGTMYQHQSLFSMGNVGAENRVFENQTFEVNGTTIGWTNVNNTMDSTGAGGVTFNTINADGGEWDYWDDNFGAAPLGVIPPAGFPTDPFGP